MTNPDNKIQDGFIKKSVLILGDAVFVLKSLNEQQINLTITSPPYFNQRGEYALYKDFNDYRNQMKAIYSEVFRLSKDGAIFCMNIGEDRGLDLKSHTSIWLEEVGFEYVDTLCWNKNAEIGQRGAFLEENLYYPNFSWEPIFIYKKPSHNTGRQFPRFEDRFSQYILSRLRSNVWEVTPARHSWHPASYPLVLAENLIKVYSQPGDIILDPFGGSGTTAKATNNIGGDRKYILTERMPEYYDKMVRDVEIANSNAGFDL
jgi:DNA modification methylase